MNEPMLRIVGFFVANVLVLSAIQWITLNLEPIQTPDVEMGAR